MGFKQSETCGLESDEAGNFLCNGPASTFVNVRVTVDDELIYASLPLCGSHAARWAAVEAVA